MNIKPREGDYCAKCHRLLTLISEPEDATGQGAVVLIQGEVDCCCGDYDTEGHHIYALCADCCGPHQRLNGGSGYYIVSPSTGP
jgi:hypothetical protein